MAGRAPTRSTGVTSSGVAIRALGTGDTSVGGDTPERDLQPLFPMTLATLTDPPSPPVTFARFQPYPSK
eukprot:jgi/Tetstr1/423059/TSEL_013830.t1